MIFPGSIASIATVGGGNVGKPMARGFLLTAENAEVTELVDPNMAWGLLI